MVPLFERNPTELRLIFKLNFIYQRHHHRLESWNLFFVQPPVMDHRTIMHFRKIIIYNSF